MRTREKWGELFRREGGGKGGGIGGVQCDPVTFRLQVAFVADSLNVSLRAG